MMFILLMSVFAITAGLGFAVIHASGMPMSTAIEKDYQLLKLLRGIDKK